MQRNIVVFVFLVLLLSFLAPAPHAHAATLNFAAAVSYGAGTRPYAVAVGDFNGTQDLAEPKSGGDGKSDLAVANFSSDNVSVLLGNGAGGFLAAVNYSVGSGPVSVSVGDFNRDGKSDLAVANFNSNNVSILLGNGDGTFAAAVNYGVGTSPYFVAVGDFNRDGQSDLAVANFSSNDVSVLLGNGGGTFAAAVNYGVGTKPVSVAVGDFDCDGKPDLAVANSNSNNVSVLLGNGDGAFAAAVNYGVGTSPYSVEVGDFNADGKSDLAVANWGSANVSVLLGNGAGAFAAAVNYGAGTNPVSVAVGDFNDDGKSDLAVANQNSANVSVLSGNGDGTFAAAVNYGVGTSPYCVAVDDFNRDGKSDLAVANYGSSNVSVLLNTSTHNPSGGFAAAVNYGAGGGPQSVAVGDFNRDGKSDLAVANYNSDNVSVLLGNGAGAFAAAANYGAGTDPGFVVVGDFNRDGKSDLAVANWHSYDVSVLLGNGDGTFAAAVNYGVDGIPISVAVGDFNRDGKSDLAVANFSRSAVSVLLGTGDGTFASAVNYGVDAMPMSIAVGDFNRDGKSDLANTYYVGGELGLTTYVSRILGNGDGTFANLVTNEANCLNGFLAVTSGSVAVDDFNRDGKSDVAVTCYFGNTVRVHPGWAYSFITGIGISTGTEPWFVAVGDFNRDGKSDLAVANSGSSDVSVVLNTSTYIRSEVAFAAAVNYGAGGRPQSVAVGDFNGDGKPDLAVANLSNVSVLLSTGRTATVTTEIHDASHNVITSASIGSSVHDKATVAGSVGTPTGTVDFTVYANTTCTGPGTAAGTVTLDGSGIAYPSNTATVTSSGLSFKAHYNGDASYNAADGACEPLTATKLTPTVSTQIHDASHIGVTSAPFGSTVHDKATVAGSLGTPTGTVDFTVYANTTCTGTGSASQTVALDGSGIAHPSQSSTVTWSGLSFKAHYNGDANYDEADSACEPLTATKYTPTIATDDIHDASHTVITSAPIGSSVHNKVSLWGSVVGTPTGTVDFTVWANTMCYGTGTAAGTVTLDGSGVADPSDSATVTFRGLSFMAHYNGDASYNAVDSPCKPLTAIKLTPTVTTDIHDASETVITSAPIGSSVHDKATVTGSVGTPTGSVSFTVYGGTACNNPSNDAGNVTLDASGVAHPSDSAIVTHIGRSFMAHYNGDVNYDAADSACEPLTATKATPTVITEIHDASHNVITSAPIGSTVHDQATVAGSANTPTGSVSFTVYANTTCSGTGTAAGTVTLPFGSHVAHPSNTATMTSSGLSFKAHYNGDTNYNAADSACEPLTKPAPTVTTDIHDASHAIITSALIGSSVHDKATVAGSFGTPTGAVDFTVYAGTTCNGTGTAAGTVTLDGSGVAHPSNSATVTSSSLSFKAHYNGDANYDAADSACEPLTAIRLTPTVTTGIHDASETVITSAPIGSSVHDQATVAGSAGTPTGTVDFTVYAGTTCSGTGAAAGTVTLDESGVAHPSNSATVTWSSLSFKAHYNGDANYTAADSACEPLTATKATPIVTTEIHNAYHAVITSAQIFSGVHDKATVAGSVGTPTGRVDFKLYEGTTCNGTEFYAGTVTLVSGVADPSNTVAVTSGGLSFKAHYIGDTNYNAADSACEPLTATKFRAWGTTDIHDASHTVITSAPIGSSVHDKATFSGENRTPTGAVDFTVYANLNCNDPGTAAGTVPLDESGVADPSDSATVTGDGLSFKAHYNGDEMYNAVDSACEPLTILCISTGSTDWSLASTWTCGHVPVHTEQVVIASGHIVSLSGDVWQSGSITLDGSIDTGAHILTLGPSATLSGAGEVVGTVRRTSPAAGSALFFNNVPTTLNFRTAPTQMDVKLTKAAHPNANAAGGGASMLARYYTLTPTGNVKATVCLGYQDSELGPIAEAKLRLCRWNTGAGQWNCPARSASSSTTNNTVCADDVTQFSDWTLSASDPTAVMLASFRAAARRFDPAAWLADIVRR